MTTRTIRHNRDSMSALMQHAEKMSGEQLLRLLACAEAITSNTGSGASIQLLQRPERSEEDWQMDTLAEILDELSDEALFILSHSSKDLAADFPRHQPAPAEHGRENSHAASVLRTAQLLSPQGIMALLSEARDLDRQYPTAKKVGNVVRLVRGGAA